MSEENILEDKTNDNVNQEDQKEKVIEEQLTENKTDNVNQEDQKENVIEDQLTENKTDGKTQKEEKVVSKSRFDQIYKQNKDLERRLSRYIDQRIGFIPEAVENKPKPILDNFESHDEYIEALTDWKVEQKYNEHNTNQRKHYQKVEKDNVESNIQRKIQTQMQVDPNFTTNAYIPAEIADLVHDSDRFIDLAYFFGENRDVAIQLCHAPKHVAARELGRLEAQLENIKSPAPKIKTGAPRNTNAIDGKANSPTKDPDKMSDKEFDVWYNETLNPYRKRKR